MWRGKKKFVVFLTFSALGLGTVILVVANLANSGLPAGSEEVELASLPRQVLEDAHRFVPGVTFQRAWKFPPGGQLEAAGIAGYVLRSRVSWYESRDIAVYASDQPAEPESHEPIR